MTVGRDRYCSVDMCRIIYMAAVVARIVFVLGQNAARPAGARCRRAPVRRPGWREHLDRRPPKGPMMLSHMESEQWRLLKRLKHEGCVDVEDCADSLGPLLEIGLVRTVERGGPTLIVLSGRGVQASETPYSV